MSLSNNPNIYIIIMFKQIIFTFLGFLFLTIGIVGIFIPVLPTTPLVVLASICFAGNKKMTALLMKSKLFSGFINNYKNKTGVSAGVKVRALVFITITIAVSLFLTKLLWLRILLLCIYTAVVIHILTIKTLRK